VAYPRCREQGGLHLQLVGIWEPSTLASSPSTADQTAEGESNSAELPTGAELPTDALPEGDDYFSVRGELIFTKPETGDLVIKVRQLPRADGQRPAPFKLQLRGEIPLEHLRHFVAIEGRRQGQQLLVERFEVIAPVVQRGNRGGKGQGRRDGRPAGGRKPQAAPPAGERSRAVPRSAVTRPGR
jgi:hypothetical protein